MVVAGIIRPPPDIRAVADRTALFVSKNGRAFEIKILNSEKGKTPKFAFLHGSSPFHAYYEDRIRFYEEGGTDEEEKRKEEEERLKKQKEEEERLERERKEKEEAEAISARKEAARKKASAVDPVARALLGSRAKIESAKRASSSASKDGGNDGGNEEENSGSALAPSSTTMGPTPPPPLRHVSLLAPANLSHLEVEIIKLTAQYVALSSSSSTSGGVSRDNFLTNLTLKEWSNPQFAFLQPRHGHYAYFTALVDGYRSFLPAGEDYERAKNKARMDARKDRLAHLILDDDSNVRSIISKKEKSTVLHECLERAAYRAEYERDMAERKREAAEGGADGGLGGAGTIDWHDFVVVETIEFPVDEVVQALPPPTSLRLAVLTKEQAVVGKDSKEEQEEEQEEEEMEESSSDDDNVDMDDGGEKLKVVSNYQPKVVSTKEIITGDASRTHIIDPISGKSVAIADMPEHMRIQLLDPKWAEERKRFLDKQRETNFVAGEDIASNISRFLQARGGDLFGSSASDIHDQKVNSEKRLMEANRLIREQAMQPMPQPQGVAMLSAPAAGVVPPPPPPPLQMGVQPPVFAPPMPPPLPQQQYLVQPTIPSEEPEAKRLKVDDPSIAIYPPAQLSLPNASGIIAPGVLAPPPPPPSASQPDELLSESDFIATLSDPDDIPICIRVPHDSTNSNWNFNGQTIDITVKATSQVKELKEMLSAQLGGMPMNKMQLKHPSSGFMNKDGLTMAYFNVGPMTTIDLVPKTRGGRK
ncbi:hypothetical protein ACHAXH_005637 [Discostella pseudostelligera]